MLRSLTIIYGFFFVLMAALLTSASSIAYSLYVLDPLFLYFLIAILSISIAIIGNEILRILIVKGLSTTGIVGIGLLISFLPILFIWVLGKTFVGNIPVIPGMSFQAFGLAELGVISLFAFNSVTYMAHAIHSFWKKKQKPLTATSDSESTHSEKDKTSTS